jgi:subtilisin family serine protease
VRLPLVAAAAALLVAALPALPALASDSPSDSTPLRVTAVVRDAHGHLTFRHGDVRGSAAAKGLAKRWRAESGVVAADVAHPIHISGAPDPLAPQQWALSTLQAAQVGDATGQVVAVVDTGVDATHPDLAGVVLAGTDFVSPGGDGRNDPNGHGTHVSGIIAAVGDNGIGVAGLAQGAKILPVRVMGADGSGYDSDAAAGVVWASDHGANVINLSLGGPDRSTVMDSAVQYALSKGVSVVVAAGNDATPTADPVEWPAADPGVLAVGAVDSSGIRPSWSSTGAHLAVAAPGVDILSTVPVTTQDPSGYASWSGTSMAAPFVSAAAALLRHTQPGLTAAGVRSRLMATADDLGLPGFDSLYGAGRVDVLAAEGRTQTVAQTPASPAPSPSQSVAPSPVPVPVLTPAPVPTDPAQMVMSARISASRLTAPYLGAVTVTTRVLADGTGLPGLGVELQRFVNGSWVSTRTGLSGDGGLAGWVLHPDRTTYYRTVGSGWVSPLIQIVVTPVVSLRVSTAGAAGRVLPSGVRTVRIDRRSGTSWYAVASVVSAADGTFHLTRRLAVGTVLRAVSSGAGSLAVRVL